MSPSVGRALEEAEGSRTDRRIQRTEHETNPDDASEQHLTPNERAAKGKAAREANPREGHAAWSASQRTLRPMSLLLEQEETRVPELVPIRHGRMATSPFAYFRGAALPMAADWSPRRKVVCGSSYVEMPTCRILAALRRPNVNSSSMSTISTRRLPGRSSGM